jgi:hypothetical protein
MRADAVDMANIRTERVTAMMWRADLRHALIRLTR